MEARAGDVVRIGSLELRFLVDETRGSGSLVMFEFVVLPALGFRLRTSTKRSMR